jgi:hypothetical protein
MSSKKSALEEYQDCLDQWKEFNPSQRYNIFHKVDRLLGEQNFLLDFTDKETVNREYDQYQRETRQKAFRRSPQKTTDCSTGFDQLLKRIEILEITTKDQQLSIDNLDVKIDDLDDFSAKLNKQDIKIDDLTDKHLNLKVKLIEIIESHHKCASRNIIFKHNELKNEERFKRLESELEQERLLRKNLERQYDELFCLVNEKLKL